MRQQVDFTKGKIVGPLLWFAVPILFALFLQANTGIAVSHWAWNSVFDRAADTAVLRVHGGCEKEAF